MRNVVEIKSKSEATKILNEYPDVVDQNNIRQTVQNALSKLNDVEKRIDTLENRGFFKRMIGGISGKNQKDMISTMRDISDAQNVTIQLVLSLAIMHSHNQRAMQDILDELEQSKGTYTRIADHIEFLYMQVESVKSSQRNTSIFLSRTKKYIQYAVISIGFIAALLFGLDFFL